MRPAKKIQLKEFVSCMCRISVIGSFKTFGEIKKPIKALKKVFCAKFVEFMD
jgi:hypothetical protein